jgi:hypothetical protein
VTRTTASGVCGSSGVGGRSGRWRLLLLGDRWFAEGVGADPGQFVGFGGLGGVGDLGDEAVECVVVDAVGRDGRCRRPGRGRCGERGGPVGEVEAALAGFGLGGPSGRAPSTVCAVKEKLLVLLGGVVLAVVVGGVAVVGDGPPILACAATVAFLALGYVLPPRGLTLFIVRRQRKPLGVAGAAALFAFLGVWLVWASTVALDATDSYTRFTGWVVLAWFTTMGASSVSALRCAESQRAGRAE